MKMRIKHIRKENPLIHCMTNVVVTNFTANGLLAIGASPVMAYAKEEVTEMAKVAGALLLNIGTLSHEQAEAMLIAGQAATQAGVPVVLDPVGAGATTLRTDVSKRLLEQVNPTVLRGNAGEIASLLGKTVNVKGVDGAISGDNGELAKQAAKQFGCLVAVTGEIDAVSDGHRVDLVYNGHPWLTKVVGAGCLLGAVIAAFLASEKTDPLRAVTEALSFTEWRQS